jgi:hypothetical protein
MKIEINLVAGSSTSIVRTALFLKLIGGIFILTSFGTIWQAFLMKDELGILNERLEVQESISKQKSKFEQKIPSASEQLRISNFAKDSRLLFSDVRTRFLGVLSRLEQTMDEEAYLQEIRFDRVSGDVTVAAESVNEDSLAAFVASLEKSSVYKDVKLIRRSSVRIGGKEGSRFQIRMILVGGR